MMIEEMNGEIRFEVDILDLWSCFVRLIGQDLRDLADRRNQFRAIRVCWLDGRYRSSLLLSPSISTLSPHLRRVGRRLREI